MGKLIIMTVTARYVSKESRGLKKIDAYKRTRYNEFIEAYNHGELICNEDQEYIYSILSTK